MAHILRYNRSRGQKIFFLESNKCLKHKKLDWNGFNTPKFFFIFCQVFFRESGTKTLCDECLYMTGNSNDFMNHHYYIIFLELSVLQYLR